VSRIAVARPNAQAWQRKYRRRRAKPSALIDYLALFGGVLLKSVP
jgi:hypothetical protein